MATLKDVAARAGVTVTTVSRMLNKRVKVSDATCQRIETAMKELGYQPNELAQSLAKKTSNFIGLIVPSASHYFFCEIVSRVEHYVTKNGYRLLLCASNHEREKELEYFQMLGANKVAGVIVASRTQNLQDGLRFDAPILSIDRKLSPSIPSVSSDNYAGGVLAAELLLRKGCKHPAYFSGSPWLDMDANKRYSGFEDTLRRNGVVPLTLELSEERFMSMRYDDVIAEFLRGHPMLDSVFTSNDVIAAQVIRYCLNSGIAVPERMKVIGYDDIGLTSLYYPTITTIRQPIDEICRYAVESVISYYDKLVPVNTVFPVTLVEREST